MMPVEGRYNDTMYLAETQLPSLIDSFELYCSEMHMARKGEIEKIVLEPKKLLKETVHVTFDILRQGLSEHILVPMRDREEDWILEARKFCREWADKFKGSLQIIKNYGVQKTFKRTSNGVNWDADLQKIGKETIETHFANFKKSAASWPHSVAAKVTRLCDSPRDQIKRK